jgi:5-methylcytosine-specific restriction endonuclease McrA
MDNPWTCEHTQRAVKRRHDSSGRPFFQDQCVECGYAIGPMVARSKVGDPESVPVFDEVLRAAGECRKAERQAERTETVRREWEKASADRKRELAEYYETPEWRAKRQAVLVRDNHECKAQLDCCVVRAESAHHLTYAHVFNEPLFDLVAVCWPCHERLHPT